mmetsp:Transcript_13426/g.21139  ORF Transcript_13426/g.21139 Transcript_13426/m.21139 type:complete len:94 (+) Transcript_13426:17-298(+)
MGRGNDSDRARGSRIIARGTTGLIFTIDIAVVLQSSSVLFAVDCHLFFFNGKKKRKRKAPLETIDGSVGSWIASLCLVSYKTHTETRPSKAAS